VSLIRELPSAVDSAWVRERGGVVWLDCEYAVRDATKGTMLGGLHARGTAPNMRIRIYPCFIP
jgi:hypothetical protein